MQRLQKPVMSEPETVIHTNKIKNKKDDQNDYRYYDHGFSISENKKIPEGIYFKN